MKRLALAAAGLALSVASASAADMAARPVKALPPAPVIMSWTGFYAGINGGGVWSDNQSMTYFDLANIGNTNNAYAPTTVNASASGGIAGIHAGYNWQTAPNWVFGIEGDWDWTNLRANGTNRLSTAVTNTLLTDNAFLETKINWLASLRGRVGYASPNWLLYATGGVAFADANFNAAVHCTAVPLSFCTPTGQDIRPTGFSDVRVGGVVGGGVEFKPASNWTFGVEYLYYRFNSTQGGGSWTFWNGTPAPFFACTTPGQNCARFTYGDIGLNTVRARLSYQFNTPVVAKY